MDERWRQNGQRSLRAALTRAFAAPAPTSLLLVDPDHLLWLNDSFGWEQGDRALLRVWHCLDHAVSIDPGGTVFRTSGGAYSVLLPRVGAPAAALIAEQIRATVSSLRVANPRPPDGRGWLTVSIGVATHVPDAGPAHALDDRLDDRLNDRIDALIELAAERRYQAKVRGRDRVVAD